MAQMITIACACCGNACDVPLQNIRRQEPYTNRCDSCRAYCRANTRECRAPSPPPFRAGDAVKHGPTGETWVVAGIRDGYLAWVGWPEGRAKVEDCTLVKAATDSEHRQLLDKLASSKSTSFRVRWAREDLAKLTA